MEAGLFIIIGGPRVLFMLLLFPWPDVRFKLDVRLARLASRSPVTIFWLAVLAAAELAATMGWGILLPNKLLPAPWG